MKYYSEEAINAPLPECTVYRNIYEYNKEHLSDTALQYYGVKITYKQLFDEIEACAKALCKNGVKRGDRVTIFSSGVPEVVYLILACSKIGALANCVNPMFTTEQMVKLINDSGSEWLFVLDAMYSYISDALDKTNIRHIVIIPATASLPTMMQLVAKIKEHKADHKLELKIKKNKYLLWESFIKNGVKYTAQTEVVYQKEQPVIMVYSSGTTGASKGIVLTNDGLNATIHEFEISGIEFKRHQKYLHIVPIWFSTGIVFNLLMPLKIGMQVILEPVFSKETFARDIVKYKPSHMMAATSIWIGALQEKIMEKADLSFLILPMTGGEALLEKDEAYLNDYIRSKGFCSNINKGYGMCELGSASTAAANDFNKIGSVGIPLPHVSISAFDVDTDSEKQYGQCGELRVITPCRMIGYYNNPKATAEFFHTDANGHQWACTGDIGYVDEDGNVFVLGRANDSYRGNSGKTHYLFKIENVILSDHAVAQCKAVVIDSMLVAHIVLNKKSVEDEKDLIVRIADRCLKNLDKEEIPYAYKIRTEFVVKPSGKRDVEALKKERNDFYIIAENGSVIKKDIL